MIPRVRPAIEAMQEYQVTSQDVWRIREVRGVLKLDWNESPESYEIVRKRLMTLLTQAGCINWYPDVSAIDLCKAIAHRVGVSPLQVLAFGGSDVALETVARVYLDPGDSVCVPQPGYDNFRVYAESCGARVVSVGVGSSPFEFSVEQFIAALLSVKQPKAIYLINPNNPLGYLLSIEQIKAVLEHFPDSVVLLDEAYIEFADSEASAVGLVRSHENLFVFRSFSKAFGMAGLRLGYLVSDQRNLSQVKKLRNGKNVSMFAQVAGEALLKNMEVVNRHVAKVIAGKKYFIQKFTGMGGSVLDGAGNFSLIRVPKPQEVMFRLKAAGIYARDRSQIPGLAGTIRITFGYPEHMDRVLKVFREMPAECWRE